jgi:hypothetical protein
MPGLKAKETSNFSSYQMLTERTKIGEVTNHLRSLLKSGRS